MTLTTHLLDELETQHHLDVPDLVTSFIIQQQALHKQSERWPPQISETSDDLRGGANHGDRQNLGQGQRAYVDTKMQCSGGRVSVTPEINILRKIKANRTNNKYESTYMASRKRRQDSWSSDSSFIEYAQQGITTKDTQLSQMRPGNEISEILRREYGKRSEKVDGRRTKNFEKRARYKMIDPAMKKSNRSNENGKPARKKRRRGEIAARNKSDALLEGFSAETISNQRITLCPSHKLGIFKNGRASSQGSRRGLPDLSFSEVDFFRSKNTRVEEISSDEDARNPYKRAREKRRGKSNLVPKRAKRTRSLTSISSVGPDHTHIRKATPEGQAAVPESALEQEALSSHSRRSVTINPDDHSEYSLLGTQSRFAKEGGSQHDTEKETLSTTANAPTSQQDGSSGGLRNPSPGAKGQTTDNTLTLLQKKPSSIQKASLSPLEELLRICDDFQTTEVIQETIQTTGKCGRVCNEPPTSICDYISNEIDVGAPQGRHAPVEYMGSASALSPEEYRTNPPEYLEKEPINPIFYPNDEHDIYEGALDINENRFMHTHSNKPEINEFCQGKSYYYQEPQQGCASGIPEEDLYDNEHLYNSNAEQWQDSECNVSVHENGSTENLVVGNSVQSWLLMVDDTVGPDLKGFWRPHRWN